MEAINDAVTVAGQQPGFSQLREKQRLAVVNFMLGNDVFVSLPTGSGKSLCYWVLPKAFDIVNKSSGSLVIVISPLIALMKDQVQVLTEKGINAIYSGGAEEEETETIKCGEYQIIFFSPESLLCNLEWRDMLQSPIYQEKLVAFVVDEAHCVKKW